MTDRNAAPITAVSVVDNSKYVCYVAVVVIASDDSFVDLVARLANVAKMPPNVRWQQIRRIRAHQCIEPAATTGCNASPIMAGRKCRKKHQK